MGASFNRYDAYKILDSDVMYIMYIMYVMYLCMYVMCVMYMIIKYDTIP